MSEDFITRPCSCSNQTRLATEGFCPYGGICPNSILVYKVTCTTTGGVSYIGNIKQYFKYRMRCHFQDVKKLVERNLPSDSYALHFAGLVQQGHIVCKALWQGNPLSVVKTFGKNSCKLCNRERIEILKQAAKTRLSGKTINSCMEIHGACRHLPWFHRLIHNTIPSADERKKPKKSTRMTMALGPDTSPVMKVMETFQIMKFQVGIKSNDFIPIQEWNRPN
jgi:hypothetical protein